MHEGDLRAPRLEASERLGVAHAQAQQRPAALGACRMQRVLALERDGVGDEPPARAQGVPTGGQQPGSGQPAADEDRVGPLEADTIDMKCLLIIGASTTSVTAAGQVWTPRFVE